MIRRGKISPEQFDKMTLSFDDLDYEMMVLLWCWNTFSDAMIAEKCEVPVGKVKYLRQNKYDIKLYNIDEHVYKVWGIQKHEYD